MVQWLRLHASTAGGTGSIPGWERSCLPCGTAKKKKEKKRIFKDKSTQIIKVWLNEYLQREHTHVTTIQNKKKTLTEGPISHYLQK